VDRPPSGHDVGKVASRQVDRLVAVAAVVVVKAVVVGVERDAGLAQGLLDLAAQGELGEGDRADPEQCIAGGAARSMRRAKEALSVACVSRAKSIRPEAAAP
jgi:hypothetical protein